MAYLCNGSPIHSSFTVYYLMVSLKGGTLMYQIKHITASNKRLPSELIC